MADKRLKEAYKALKAGRITADESREIINRLCTTYGTEYIFSRIRALGLS